MDKADLFVILDCPDFNRRGFTHRNKIKCPEGQLLLTVPIQKKNGAIQKIMIDHHQPWIKKHIGALQKNYARSTYWSNYREDIEQIYQQSGMKLMDLTLPLIMYIKKALGIDTPIVLESELGRDFGVGSHRIAGICKFLGADVYLSGKGAQAYQDEAIFEAYGVHLQYQAFHHPKYTQLWGDFIANLSVIDLLFNCGPDALAVIRTFNP